MRSLSIVTLIGSNLIPLIGVVFFDWSEVLVLALFWIENLVIGAFNLLKMLILSAQNKQPSGLFISAFFVLHYGLFWSVHGSFLWDLLNLPELSTHPIFESAPHGPLELFAEGATVLMNFYSMFGVIISLSVMAITLSHAVSFIENFILGGGIFKFTAKSLMGKPYTQVLIMHAGLMIGAIAIDKLGSTIGLLVVMVLFKLIVDVWQHQRRHKRENSNEVIPHA